MNCAEFEQGLVKLVAEEPAEDERRRLFAGLRAHASACGECAGSADLVTILGSPAGQRDIVDDPGDAYWTGFEERLAGRLDSRPAERRSSARTYWVAAAAVALLLVTGSLLLGPRDPAQSVAENAGAQPPAVDLDAGELPDSLVLSLTQASVEEVEDQLTVLEGWDDGVLGGDVSEDDAMFPDVEGLDPETRRELLEWLRDQNSGFEGAKG